MSFPQSGTIVPPAPSHAGAKDFATIVSEVLRRSHGNTHSAIKVVARWTGASERAVKNWFAGRTAPCGDHFVGLATHSPEILAAFLVRIGRKDCLAVASINEARVKVHEALVALDAAADHGNK
jgi:hypothetical protein